MDNLDGDKIIEEAEKSLERLSRKIEQLEYDSKRDVLKHFDRLHDKLFMFNTIFITGYFALCQINKEFNSLILLLPFCSLSMLIYIEHFMKEIARKQSYGMFEVNLSESRKEIWSGHHIVVTYYNCFSHRTVVHNIYLHL